MIIDPVCSVCSKRAEAEANKEAELTKRAEDLAPWRIDPKTRPVEVRLLYRARQRDSGSAEFGRRDHRKIFGFLAWKRTPASR